MCPKTVGCPPAGSWRGASTGGAPRRMHRVAWEVWMKGKGARAVVYKNKRKKQARGDCGTEAAVRRDATYRGAQTGYLTKVQQLNGACCMANKLSGRQR